MTRSTAGKVAATGVARCTSTRCAETQDGRRVWAGLSDTRSVSGPRGGHEQAGPVGRRTPQEDGHPAGISPFIGRLPMGSAGQQGVPRADGSRGPYRQITGAWPGPGAGSRCRSSCSFSLLGTAAEPCGLRPPLGDWAPWSGLITQRGPGLREAITLDPPLPHVLWPAATLSEIPRAGRSYLRLFVQVPLQDRARASPSDPPPRSRLCPRGKWALGLPRHAEASKHPAGNHIKAGSPGRRLLLPPGLELAPERPCGPHPPRRQ